MSLPSHSSSLSSGDLIADRRLEHARDYFAAGEAGAAAELMEQALEIVPDWAAGWFELGSFREAAGARETAIAAFERALSLDPQDRCGATLRLARLGARAQPDAPPAAHVRDLFDGYAARFERSLVDGLGYRIPQHLATLLERVAPGRRFAAGIDLGCGTGLMAEKIRDRVDRLDGVDLSPAMVAEARAKALYDGLAVGELVADLEGRAVAGFDLVIAADVFCYLGDLVPSFRAVARVLRPGGVFVFSVEALDGELLDAVRLRDSLRYAHGAGHLARAGREAGLARTIVERTVGRRDRGADIAALACVFTKT